MLYLKGAASMMDGRPRVQGVTWPLAAAPRTLSLSIQATPQLPQLTQPWSIPAYLFGWSRCAGLVASHLGFNRPHWDETLICFYWTAESISRQAKLDTEVFFIWIPWSWAVDSARQMPPSNIPIFPSLLIRGWQCKGGGTAVSLLWIMEVSTSPILRQIKL